MYGGSEYVDAEGLFSYAPSYPDLFRHAAIYVDKILKGANPGDMPIEQPTTFELVVNLNAARALGIAVPPSILARASRVIQKVEPERGRATRSRLSRSCPAANRHRGRSAGRSRTCRRKNPISCPRSRSSRMSASRSRTERGCVLIGR